MKPPSAYVWRSEPYWHGGRDFQAWRSESEIAQSCPTLCDSMDCSLPGFSVHGILQARMLEWVTIALSRGFSWPRDWTLVSHIGGRHFNLWATREVQVRLREGEARAEALRWAPTWFFKEPSNWRGVNKVRGQTGNKGPGCKGPCRYRVNFGFYSGDNEKPLECLGTEAWQDQI